MAKKPLNINESFGIIGFILGIAGIVFVIVFWPLSISLFVIGIVFSAIQLKIKSTKIAKISLAINIIGMILAIVLLVISYINLLPLLESQQ